MLLRCLSKLPQASLRHPRSTLLCVGLIAVCCLPGLTRLRLRTDGLALVSPSAPELQTDRRVRDRFRIRDTIAVVIRSKAASNVFNPLTISLVRELTAAFKSLPKVRDGDVMSLATEPGLRRRPGTLTIQPLLEPSMTTAAELDQLRDDLGKLQIYTGTLVSLDGTATIILIGMPDAGAGDRASFLRSVRRIIANHSSPENEVGLVGAPLAEAIFGTQILRDLGVPGRWLEHDLDDTAQNSGGGDRSQLVLSWVRHIGLVPLSALVMMAVLLVFFRNLAAALVPLPGLLASLLFVLGVMGWLGVPIYLTTAVMPVLLTVMSVTNDIYLFVRYFNLLRQSPNSNPAVLLEETFGNLASPVVITSLSAAVGFLSFAASPLVPVRAFGIFAAVGTLFSMLLSLTVVPALLVLIHPARFISQNQKSQGAVAARLSIGFEIFAGFILRRRWWIIGATVVLTAVTPLGILRLRVQDSWMSGFPAQSEFRRLTTRVDGDFLGSHTLLVSFDATQILHVELPRSAVRGSEILLPGNLVEEPISLAGSSISLRTNGLENGEADIARARIAMADRDGTNLVIRIAPAAGAGTYSNAFTKADSLALDIPVRTQLTPQIIQKIDDFEQYLRHQPDCSVGGALGAPDYLSTIRFVARGARPEARGLPETAVDAGILWDYYRALLGQQRLGQVLDESCSRSLITLFLKDANFVDTARLMNRIREYERQQLTPQGIKLEFAGTVAVSQSLIGGIVSTQMYSLLWSSLGIFAVTALFGGSKGQARLLRGLYCMIPSLLAVAIKFAIMGCAGIPLGVATSMFAAMTLGIGVNCAIHLLEGCERARLAGASVAEAWLQSLRWTGPAALINTIAVCLGFGVLMLSQVPANSRLGILLVLGLASCAAVSLTLLPALCAKPSTTQLSFAGSSCVSLAVAGREN